MKKKKKEESVGRKKKQEKQKERKQPSCFGIGTKSDLCNPSWSRIWKFLKVVTRRKGFPKGFQKLTCFQIQLGN